MKKINLKPLLLALAFLLAAGISPALAEPGMGGPGPGPQMGGPGGHPGKPDKMEMFKLEVLEDAAEKIGADAQTIAKIKDLAYNANKELIDLRAEMERAHLEMKRLMDLDSPDEKLILQQIDKTGAVEIKLRKNRISLILAVRKLLTPEQRTKLKQLMEERKGHERGMMGPDEMGCPGPGKCPKMKNMPPGEN
jgi:Spy/CpxP family protein refolding chaperone